MTLRPFIKNLRRLAKRLSFCIPTRLPRTSEQLESFCTSIFETYGIQDCQNYRIALSTVLMQLAPEQKNGFAIIRVSKRYFARHLTKIQTNETAYSYLEEQRRIEGQRQREEAQKREEARVAALPKPVTDDQRNHTIPQTPALPTQVSG